MVHLGALTGNAPDDHVPVFTQKSVVVDMHPVAGDVGAVAAVSPAVHVEVIHVENLSEVEQEQSVVSVRANWRVVATAPEAAPPPARAP